MAKKNKKRTRVSTQGKTSTASLSPSQRAALQQYFAEGNRAVEQNNFPAAGQLFQKILQIDPQHAGALEQLGLCAFQMRDLATAEKAWLSAVESKPKSVRSWYMLGCLYAQVQREDDAVKAFRKVQGLEPRQIEAHNNLGVIYKNQEKYELAIECFEQVVRLNPKSAFALSNLGNVLKEAGFMQEAVRILEKAVKADPSLSAAYSNLLMSMNYISDYTPEALLNAHQLWASHLPEHIKPERFSFNEKAPLSSKRKKRIGFLSPDFHNHSVAYFIEPLFTNLDRNKFEIYGYYNNTVKDSVNERLKSLTEVWCDIHSLDELECADKIYQDKLDVLIDLAGHTANNRLAVFAQKPAPVQISWLGYPNTSGVAQIDYRIVDEVTDPVASANSACSEKVLHLPSGFLCYQAPPDTPAIVDTPVLSGAPLTFGSFNNLVKLTDETLALWSQVLLALPDSRLLLKARQLGNELTRKRVLERFEKAGIGHDRLELHAMVPSREAHLALYQKVDVAFDTHPYNGTTTTCEALWMGVPVLTMLGDRHASRVSASILTRLGLDAWIAPDETAFIASATQWANQVDELNFLRHDLRKRMEGSPLCDARGFTAEFEAMIEGVLSF